METRRILWFALVMSTVIYLVVLNVAAPTVTEPPAPVLVYVLSAVALATLGASFVVPNLLLAQNPPATKVPTEEVGTFAELPVGTRVFTDPEAARRASAPALNTRFILTMALREAVSIFGLVLGFLGHPIEVVLPFFLVTWATMALEFPRQSMDDRLIEKATGTRFAPSR